MVQWQNEVEAFVFIKAQPANDAICIGCQTLARDQRAFGLAGCPRGLENDVGMLFVFWIACPFCFKVCIGGIGC